LSPDKRIGLHLVSSSSITEEEVRRMARILLVDDDVDLRFMMEHILIDAGYRVDATGSMSGAIELLESQPYDLVVADGKLPDGTGFDVADVAGKLSTKTVILTGYAFSLPGEIRERYEILLKPMHSHELVAAVEHALGQEPGPDVS
jgi:DNA-binding NtrC family response regulator